MNMLRSVILFVFTGLLEIGGGYLVWQCLKANKPWWYGLAGLYLAGGLWGCGYMANSRLWQGVCCIRGVFITMSLIWAWKADSFKPDKFDIIGAALALCGAFIIIYAPRK